MVNRVIICFAVVPAMVALAGCQARKKSGENQTEATAKAGEAGQAGAPAQPVPDDPFAAKIAANLAAVPELQVVTAPDASTGADLDNSGFRDRAAGFVRQVITGAASGAGQVTCDLALASKRPFRSEVTLYDKGQLLGRGTATDPALCTALKDATRRAVAAAGGDAKAALGARFTVNLPDHQYALVEFDNKGVELTHDLVPVRAFDRDMLARRIQEGKAYLLRVLDPRYKGAHKYYYAPEDSFEDKVHTIYTASTVYTMIRLYKHDGDKSLLEPMTQAVDFLLSMQNKDPRDRGYGGFYYEFDTAREQPLPKLVVGTTSKTIFTLIDMYDLTRDKKYMEAAELAASWLMSMQREDGGVRSQMRRASGGKWKFSEKESMLYTGQVLSALSRMFGATKNPKYAEAAARTATYLSTLIETRGCYLGDDFRKPNPISSSWAILSLFDFVKVTDDPHYKDMVFHCADELLARQIRDAKDVYRYGRWNESLSSSGAGWLAEVYSELYGYCLTQGMDGCERFEEAIVRVLRLLMQYTYTPESSFVAKNPEMAMGGVFWTVSERYVRTDAVCHAMNAYMAMIDKLKPGTLIEVPEPPLAARLSLTGAAK